MDSTIKKEFDRCESEGLCRSDVDGLRMKWIAGSRHLIAQYHPTWQLKRKPYFTQPKMDEPFSHEAFNFTKVKDAEVLSYLYVKNGNVFFSSPKEDSLPESVDTLFTVLLNVSPICNNHHLIVPNLNKCYPQIWKDSLTPQLLSICANSERDDYVMFFNSLGGFSSVNHLHFQVMYTSSFYQTAVSKPNPPFSNGVFDPNKLPLEYVKSTVLCKKGSVTISDVNDWMCQTIKLEVVNINDDMKNRFELSNCINTLICMCYEYDFPYDVIFSNHGNSAYVFIRKYQKSMDDLCVNPACVELTGIVVYRSEKTYDDAHEEILMNRCKETVCFEQNIWNDFLSAFVNRVLN